MRAISSARGRAAIRAAYTGQGGGPLRLRAVAAATADTVDYVIGAYRYGDAPGDQGKFTLTLRRGPDGRWLIFSDMDNASRPPRYGAAAPRDQAVRRSSAHGSTTEPGNSQALKMDIDTFVARAEAQPIVEVRRTVSIHGPELRALLAEGRIALLSEIRAHPDQHEEQRRFRYRHILEPGAAASEIAAWEAEHPHHPLPEDLIAFLGRADGVHLWADVSTGLSEYGILPLADWRDAGSVEWSEMFVDPPQGRLVISYHDNGDYFIVLDTSDRSYHWYDLQDFDNPALIGRTVAELLGWYWEQADELDPRFSAG